MLKEWLSLFLKGLGIGAANVIPGVSGGTIALITGIFEKLIHSIKSFNLIALKLIFKGHFKQFALHVNLDFLIAVFLGVAVSILTFAKVLDYLFNNYPIYIWAYFFGLILSSVYFVGKSVSKWQFFVILSFIIGTTIAVAISLLPAAPENKSFIYLLLCGIVAVCSMILPGLSGSFVLILLGNYKLVMIDAVNNLDWMVLLPVVIGAGIGLLGFSYFLSWIFKKFKDQTIAILTGFILGSLSILWPWKHEIILTFNGKEKVVGYIRYLPEHFNAEVSFAIIFATGGIISIWLLEKLAQEKSQKITE